MSGFISGAGRTSGGLRGLISTAGLVAGLAVALASSAITPAFAENCPGNPDAIGTSRTLVVDPTEHTRVGTMQYGETLPLRDHEVVLTFDDGPLPPHSTQVLNILASQCVKATFFIIGRMAKQFPDGVRRVRDAGHSIGTHSENHPLSFNHMPIERAMTEISDGIDHTTAALGNPNDLAPFFRIPGLLRAQKVEDYLASRGIMTWSADFPADDWRHITSQKVIELALSRIEAKGKGILLLHDIQARTVAALPTILSELKRRGYHIVHVVPATPDLPKTPSVPADWLMHPQSSSPMATRWPAVPSFVFAATSTFPVPDITDAGAFDHNSILTGPLYPEQTMRGSRRRVPMPAPWPRQVSLSHIMPMGMALPAPSGSLFRLTDTKTAATGVTTQRVEVLPTAHPTIGKVEAVKAASGSDTTREVVTETDAIRKPLPGSWQIPAPQLSR